MNAKDDVLASYPNWHLIYEPATSQTSAWHDASEVWVDKITDLLAAKKIPLVLAVFPHPRHLKDPAARAGLKRWEDYATKRGLPLHNAYEAIEAGGGAALYPPGDIHFNAQGTRVWSASVAAFLRPRLGELFP